MTSWAEEEALRLIVHDEYEPEKWFRQMAFRESMRCSICYHMRLTRAAQVARKGGFDAFCTTLLYSVRQKHQAIIETGQAAAKRYGVTFLERDYRPQWKAGVARSLEKGLYRQAYCGCLYSERDRFQKRAHDKQASPAQAER